MGDLINLFISLVVSGRIRDAAGVDRVIFINIHYKCIKTMS